MNENETDTERYLIFNDSVTISFYVAAALSCFDKFIRIETMELIYNWFKLWDMADSGQ